MPNATKAIVFFTILLFHHLYSDSISGIRLEPYKYLLEWGTYDGQDWSIFPTLPKSRYETFKEAFEHFENTKGSIIVELGTSRSFNHGGLIGCNSNDVNYWQPENPESWDWGAGFFTRMAAHCLEYFQPEIHTVDINSSHISRSKVMTAEYCHLIHYHIEDSVAFLRGFPNKIDLIYLDTGDMTPIEPTALLQLEEVKALVECNLLADNGLILIDDVKNQTPKKFGETSDYGKSKYSLPYLLENGFEIVTEGYQYILRKGH